MLVIMRRTFNRDRVLTPGDHMLTAANIKRQMGWHRGTMALLCLAAVLTQVSPAVALGQFLYMDCNGDGTNTQADSLGADTTNVCVYLDTSHNPDGSPASCVGASEITLNSYEFIVQASDGTVAFDGYQNLQQSMQLSLGSRLDAADMYVGYAGASILPAGAYKLGCFRVVPVSGTPSLRFASSTSLGGTYGTSFGTQCPGYDQDNTFKLGLDWLGASGCRAGDAPNTPSSAVPAMVRVVAHSSVGIKAEFNDLDSSGTLSVSLQGLPVGTSWVPGKQIGARKQIHVYGALPEQVSVGSTYDLVWKASDGNLTDSSRTRLLIIEGGLDSIPLTTRINNTLFKRYRHGLPRNTARELGSNALPLMSQLLRDPNHKQDWHKVVEAIGAIGDTSYFDSLRSFVWDRFRGTVDRSTFLAIGVAQASLGVMASQMPRALSYLEATCTPAAWSNVGWVVSGKPNSDLAEYMARSTLISLMYTDCPAAEPIVARQAQVLLGGLTERPAASDPRIGNWVFVQSLLATHERVRTAGIFAEWAQKEQRQGGDH
jgi:hypothetical protein